MLTFEELFRRLEDADEDIQIEAKSSAEAGESALKTACAFANTPSGGGGYLLLGVSRKSTPDGNTYEVSGVKNADKLQADFANQCINCFNEKLRPEMQVYVTADKKRVVVACIPESEPAEKPIYIKKQGLPKGAYRRVGSADHSCTDADIALLYALRSQYDAGILKGASLDDLDREAVREYRRTRAELNPNAEELKLSTPDLLRSIGAVVVDGSSSSVTRAGLLLFGKRTSLRRLMPSARIDYVIVPTQEWVSDTKKRHQTVELTMPLLLAVPKLVSLVVQDLPKSFQLKGRRSTRKEIPAVPYVVIREALVNAVMHREYRVDEPTQIIKFSNRLEIRNAGHSLKPAEALGTAGSVIRNPTIAAVLHETGYAETKGTGIISMRKQMHDANLTAPIFKSMKDENRFELTLLTHHLLDDETLAWLGKFARLNLTQEDARALVLAKEMTYIDNAMYRDTNSCDVLTASNGLRRLRDLGVLKPHGKGSATFYTFSEELYLGSSNPQDKGALSAGLSAKDKKALPVSAELVALLKRVGERGDSRLVDVAILRLCTGRPLSLSDLAKYVGRHPVYLQQEFLNRLIKEGSLHYLHPETPSHPRQKYLTSPLLGEVPIPPDARRQKPKAQTKIVDGDPKLPFD